MSIAVLYCIIDEIWSLECKILKIDAIIFDYGNVLSVSPYQSDIKAMADVFGVLPQPFEESYWQFRLDYDCGLSNSQSYWTNVSNSLGSKVDNSSINHLTELDVISWSRPNQTMVDFAHLVRAKGLEIALLSNMPTDLKEWVESECDWLPDFDHRSYSCDLNFAKPDERIYLHAKNGLQENTINPLFIDDRVENIEAAARCGINSLLFRDFSQLAKDLGNSNLFN